jgi:four helix bundle protein
MKENDVNRDQQGKPFDICQRTFRFALNIVHVCCAIQERPGVHWVLSKQLLRAGTSIGANIEEGQAAQSRADFISKYSIARKEARETSYWLRLIHEGRLSDHAEIPLLLCEVEELIKILTAIIKNAQKDIRSS